MKKGFIISMIISIATMIVAIWFVMNVEGNIPINWDVNGEIVGYGSPLTMLILPVVGLFTTILLYFLPKIDPKGENIKKSGPILPIMMVLIATLMLGIEVFIIMAINGTATIFNMTMFMSLLLGILFIVIGWYMPRVKHNYMLGIRTPWTLYSEEVWTKTHKVSKNWFIAIGVSFLVGMLLKMPYNLIIPMIFMAIVLIGIVVYSYILFVEEKKKEDSK